MYAVVLMFCPAQPLMLATMRQDAETPLNWTDLGVSELPTGTVTLQDLDQAVTQAIAERQGVRPYDQRGRGERKRPDSGWESLTPTEHEAVRLVSKGLGNKDIAARLFVSPRTVQTHLTHVYAKLGLTSRVQLVQETARHT